MRLPLFFMSLLASTFELPAATSEPWIPDLGDGTYQNPVLFADYSDPDVVRVGNDFWLISSSFNHTPGLPILHSRDLVNWTLVNHALLAQVPFDHFSVPRHGEGVWAPSIRYHTGKFYIFYPDPDFGIYAITASDPRRPWSAPVLVKAGKGLIDPCPLWDDDGKVYLVHGWARSRAGKNNQLTLNELSPDGTRVLDGDGRVIIDENTAGRGWTTLEGPKIYKRDRTYWIFAPIDGVTRGSQAVYRAKDIHGPYEARIVLAQGKSAINGPHQGGWVDTPAGEDWFVHFQDHGPFGRVVHLEPMAWRDGWPVMGTGVKTGAAVGEPVLTYKKPDVPPPSPTEPATSDDFDYSALGLQWQWQANSRPDFFSLSAHPGSLRLACLAAPSATGLYNAPNLLLQKFPAPAFTATTTLNLSAAADGDEAGLIVFGYSYAWIGLRKTAAGLRVVQMTNKDANKDGAEVESGAFDAKSDSIEVRVTVAADGKCRFAYSADEKSFTPFGNEFQATVSRWVGAKVGVFAAAAPAVGKGEGSGGAKSGLPSEAFGKDGHADFDWFRVIPMIP
jgi:beta-xylosidase